VPAQISAIILAAGESRRIGRPKLLLPWGKTTVLGKVLATFAAGLSMDSITDSRTETDYEILVVTGGARKRVEDLVAELAKKYPLRAVYNPDYSSGGMLSSIQAGLREAHGTAALIGLGDQPQVQKGTVRRICTAYARSGSSLVVPSFHNRRGHPWLIARPLWSEILTLPPSTTSRGFLHAHAEQVEYVPADESILSDLDTPEEYDRQRP